jgi:hypothetical protein
MILSMLSGPRFQLDHAHSEGSAILDMHGSRSTSDRQKFEMGEQPLPDDREK